MNTIAFISSFLTILALILAIYILCLDAKKLTHKMFFLMMILYAYWEFVFTIMQSVESRETFILMYKLTTIALFFVPMTLHIVMLMLKVNRKIIFPVLSLIYSAYLYFLYQNINLNLVYRDFEKIKGSWIFIRTDPGFVTVFYMTTFGFIFIIAMALIINWYIKTDFLREKKQAIILLSTISMLFIFTFIDYAIFYFTKNDLGIFAIYVCIWPIGIGFSIVRYRFLAMPPGLYSRDIFENIEESVLVLDFNKKIISANSNAKKIILKNNTVPDPVKYIPEFDKFTAIADNLLKGLENNCVENIIWTNEDNLKLAFHAKFSIIKDKYNDRIGVLIIAQQFKGMREFTDEYNITDRELDVIKNAATGLSNREIAAKLSISERTIESHIVNIYTKLNIKNKVELINILKKFSLA